jgi:hypothetical protein
LQPRDGCLSQMKKVHTTKPLIFRLKLSAKHLMKLCAVLADYKEEFCEELSTLRRS